MMSEVEQLALRVSNLERIAETREILDRTDAVAERQHQLVEQRRTDTLDKLSRVQDEHTAALAEVKAVQGEHTRLLGELQAGQAALAAEMRNGFAQIIEILAGRTVKDPDAQ